MLQTTDNTRRRLIYALISVGRVWRSSDWSTHAYARLTAVAFGKAQRHYITTQEFATASA
jgi:hypothetical protein